MLLYIIDGFNLIHNIPSLKKSNSPHSSLIHYIKKNKLTGSRNNRVVIVFDGKTNYEAADEREFKIVFSHGESADEIIKMRVRNAENKSEIIVVSDDREIRDFIKREGAESWRICDFITSKKKMQTSEKTKDISYALQREITEELRKIWLPEE